MASSLVRSAPRPCAPTAVHSVRSRRGRRAGSGPGPRTARPTSQHRSLNRSRDHPARHRPIAADRDHHPQPRHSASSAPSSSSPSSAARQGQCRWPTSATTDTARQAGCAHRRPRRVVHRHSTARADAIVNSSRRDHQRRRRRIALTPVALALSPAGLERDWSSASAARPECQVSAPREGVDPSSLGGQAVEPEQGGASAPGISRSPACWRVVCRRRRASAMSVLTEERRSSGSLADLDEVRAAVRLFAAQGLHGRRLPGDRGPGPRRRTPVLLIVAALDDTLMRGPERPGPRARHDRARRGPTTPPELDRALALDPVLVGVNARNLKTLEVDPRMTDLLPRVPEASSASPSPRVSEQADVAAYVRAMAAVRPSARPSSRTAPPRPRSAASSTPRPRSGPRPDPARQEVSMTTTSNVPAYGRFGGFGGRYVPEALIPALEQLEEVWRKAVVDPEFVGELERLQRTYTAGRHHHRGAAFRRALRRRPRHPQAQGPQPHRLAQDQATSSARPC